MTIDDLIEKGLKQIECCKQRIAEFSKIEDWDAVAANAIMITTWDAKLAAYLECKKLTSAEGVESKLAQIRSVLTNKKLTRLEREQEIKRIIDPETVGRDTNKWTVDRVQALTNRKVS